MPYVDLYSRDDYASIYYTTSSIYDNVGGFDPEKPTLMILHPVLLDTTWLENQLGDPRLYQHYNIIAFDMRSMGQSNCKPSEKHDAWVDAADLGLCCQMLHLPPCHVFALEAISVNAALRFALLFPEMCLSLALCNIPSPVEPRWTYSALEGFMNSWAFAEDLDGLEHAMSEAMTLLLGQNCDSDLKDLVVAHWEKTLPPTRRQCFVETLGVILNRSPLEPEAYEEITQPVLIIHGERNELSPQKYAETLSKHLKNAGNEPILYPVKGAGSFLSIIPGSASIANQVLVKFLSRLPLSRSDIVPPKRSIYERMKIALDRLAYLVPGKDVNRDLDPTSPLSYSCLSDEVVKLQMDILDRANRGRLSAFNPLGPDGRPLRKLSDSRVDHWFQSGKDGLSVSEGVFVSPERGKSETLKSSRSEREDKTSIKTPIAAKSDKYYVKPSAIREPQPHLNGRALIH
ncbi:alpha/beta-hydrolase [Coprinopsis marcescibilis]|uniref:Alpha/beta-hydrolase n=1 Tax=Coprinopsis marcescibilis TaxID=230819 RepID=A0A5C3L8B9_COPMA|nr:alpha/beta-hydrolase [Coprinopsis marcescibilis]